MQKIKQRFIPHVLDMSTLQEDFTNLFENISHSHAKEESIVKGQVIDVTKEVVVIDVGLKNEGRIPLQEFTATGENNIPKIGDIVEVYIEKMEGRNGKTVLSRERVVREESWGKLEIAHSKNELVDGVIFSRVKGGFTVDLSGVVAFLPGSQVDVRPIKDISSLVGIVQPFQILKMDKKLGNIVVSRRAILEESRSEARNEMLANISEGMVLEGVVKNITDYGAFIDLGNVDGLLHVTDISWNRINHPSEVLELGSKIKVMVIKFNEETKRISLGIKQLEGNPWQNIQDKLPIGQKMTGKITNITDYGAFVELQDGIEGLVHSSEISWIKTQQNPKKTLKIGQEVDFVILEVDVEKHRVSLSIKQCQENPIAKFAEKHPIGSIIKAPIRNITDFGLFVGIADDIDGLVHESDISHDGSGAQMLKSFKKGEEVECVLLSIDPEKERISLGIKQLHSNEPNDSHVIGFEKNQIVTCMITDIQDAGIEVNINETDIKGFIKKIDLSSEKSEQKLDRFVIGDKVDAKITSVDKKNNQILLSIKALEIDERKKAIKEYGSADSGARLGDILGAVLGADDKK